MRNKTIVTARVLGLLVFMGWAWPAISQTEKRVALVIGNSAYQHTAALVNPANDARDMATALQRTGFQVILEQNLSKEDMERTVAQFARLAKDADVALFYYAGHGMQFGGQNYLVPVNATLRDEFDINFEMARVDDVLSVLERARVRIVILDACRSNPLAEQLAGRGRSFDSRGLARIQPTSGMLVAYATQPNQTADDSDGSRNSPFTAALIRRLAEPGIEIAQVFRRVTYDVNQATHGRQTPEVSVSLLGELYLTQQNEPSISDEAEAWSKIESSQDEGALNRFIATHPHSPFVALANAHLAALYAARKQIASQHTPNETSTKNLPEPSSTAAAEAPASAATGDRIEPTSPAQPPVTLSTTVPLESTGAGGLAKPPPTTTAIANAAAAAASSPAASRLEGNASTANDVAILPPPPVQNPEAAAVAKKELAHAILGELRRVGCYEGSDDAPWEGQPRSALQRFFHTTPLQLTTKEPDPFTLEVLKRAPDKSCRISCNKEQVRRGDRCVEKTCPSGQTLSEAGYCIGAKHHDHEQANQVTRDASSPERRPRGAPTDFCNQYADQAVIAAKQNTSYACGFTGLRWINSYQAHYQFCIAAPMSAAIRERALRQQGISACHGGL